MRIMHNLQGCRKFEWDNEYKMTIITEPDTQ